ncbi:MAG: DinB family protein [Bryobacteraceae bacterium]|nr:DinB family protein [Bryobacteraceae bacterium]
MIPLLLLLFQSFTPDLPPSIPKAEGTVVEMASFRYIDLRVGTGDTAKPGQKYKVHYTGWLRDGKKFDSSVDRSEPFDFVQGRRQVIAGWEMGFEGMRVGGKRRLFIPYQMAYGEKGNAAIPGKAELIFDVDLLGVTDMPELVPAAEILAPMDEYRDKIIGLAKAIPADKYGWRPAPGVRSTGEVFTHIAMGLKLMLDIAMDQPEASALDKRVTAQMAAEKEPQTKEKIVAMLEANFAEARKAILPLRAGSLGTDAEFFGKTTTRRGILIYVDTHLAEHMGQAIAYARMNGIVPPWSK